MRSVLFRICPWSLALLVAGGAAAQADLDASPAATARALLRAEMLRSGVPGLSCAVAVGDELVFSDGFGLADVENGVPAGPGTVYRLASISKPITAVLAMQLVERGELDLDADVADLVAAWPAKRWPVTTRQLLGHLGGVRHYAGEGESTVPYATQTDGLARFAADPLLHEPGTAYRYSTYGFNLVAAVIEARTGRPFAAVVAERVAAPCAAPTLQADDVRRIVPGRAQGYVRRDGVLENSELMDASYKLGGGGLCASAEDLVRFASALLAGRLVEPDTLAAMWTEQRTTAGDGTGYGRGFGVRTVGGRRVVSHSGAQPRVSTMLYLLPDERVAVAVLCNLERVRLGEVARRVAFAFADGAAVR